MKEKYAVVLDDEKTKTAEKDNGSTCPKCGRPVNFGAMKSKQFPWCEECGTEPFEKKE